MCNFEQRIATPGDILINRTVWSVAQMRRRSKTEVAGMWINPNSTLSRGHIIWDRRKADSMNARYLDLAEVALRAKIERDPVIKFETRNSTSAGALVSTNLTRTEILNSGS